ncbi:MAG: DUF4296 domain-containing protein [Marinilabilia sp.]
MQSIIKILKTHFLPGLVPLILVLMTVACSPREKVPREFPDEEEMAEILTDLYVTENLITQGGESSIDVMSDDAIPGYYSQVLEKHDLSRDQFDTIRKWYAAHPYHYQRVYDRIIVQLNSREAQLNREMREAEEKADTVPEVVDLWEKERTLMVDPDDTIDPRLPFSIELDSLNEGNLRLSVYYKFLREDLTREGHMAMMAHYADTISDTVTYELEKTFQPKTATITLNLDTIGPVKKVSGFLFEHDTTTVTGIEFSRIRLEHLTSEEEEAREEIPGIEKTDLPER